MPGLIPVLQLIKNIFIHSDDSFKLNAVVSNFTITLLSVHTTRARNQNKKSRNERYHFGGSLKVRWNRTSENSVN